MQFDSLTMRILNGRRGEYATLWSDGNRICSDYSRLYLLENGAARVWWDNESYQLQPGRIYLFPAHHPFRYLCDTSMTLLWCHFNIELIPGVDIFTRFKPLCERAAPRAGLRLMRQLLDGYATDAPRSRLIATARLCELVQPFFPENWDTLMPPHGAFGQIAPLLSRIVADPAADWTLAAMAEEIHLSPTYCSNLFSRVMGTTPIRFVNRCRLSMARSLLVTTDITVADVAEQCGFRDAFYFSRLFRKSVGCAPNRFRQSRGLHP